ncbi:MAG: hypothetical protein H6R31_227, partial [Methanomicrobia archaeon]|nr:hypothetical protein [Methanomicrobia archaeon]
MADAQAEREEKPETSEMSVEELMEEINSARALAEERLELLMRCRA